MRMLRNDFGKLRIIAVDAKCMYCFTYCNVPQSKRSLWGYLWWWEGNLKTSNILSILLWEATLKGHDETKHYENKSNNRVILRLHNVWFDFGRRLGYDEQKKWFRCLDLRLSWQQIGASSLLATGLSESSVYKHNFHHLSPLGVVCTIVTLRHNVLFAFALSEKEMLKQVVSVVNFISSWTQCIGMVTITTGYT